MRLIHSETLEIREFSDKEIPEYAILSHTWGSEEVTFQEMRAGTARSKQGFAKVELCARQAVKDGIEWVWVDTCCIDKTSSSELSEAINSMYRWYKRAKKCYAYLTDVGGYPDFAESRWFTRGWTLQELIAPERVEFYGQSWSYLGSKAVHAKQISEITGIDAAILYGEDLHRVSVSRRMSWAAERQTTRVEDMAYCLMGIFDVNMPLLYGEGEKAFVRLQQEIMKESDDQSLFAWANPAATNETYSGMLALSPSYFINSGKLRPYIDSTMNSAYSMTNKGLSLQLLIPQKEYTDGMKDGEVYCFRLDCAEGSFVEKRPFIQLKCLSAKSKQFTRIKSNILEVVDDGWRPQYLAVDVYVRQKTLMPSLGARGDLYGFRVEFETFKECLGYSLHATYPCPSDQDYGVAKIDTPDGKFGALQFHQAATGFSFTIILGLHSLYGVCCCSIENGQYESLRSAYYSCQFSHLIFPEPSNIIRFPTEEDGGIRLQKAVVQGKTVLVVKFVDQRKV